MKQFLQLTKIQYLEFFRVPGVIFWALMFPIVMAWGLGLAFNSKGQQERTIAWVQTSPVGKIMKDFIHGTINSDKEQVKIVGNKKTGFVTYHFVPASWQDATLMVKRGKTPLIISESTDSVKYFFDPKNPEAQLAYLQLSAVIGQQSHEENTEQIQPLDQKGMRYIDFLVPGLMAMNIMFGSLWGISYSLIEKRSKKLLRRMIATPMNKTAFLASYFVTRISLSIIEMLFLLFFSWWYFGITVQGSIPALVSMLIAGNIVFFGLAILLSSRTSNTQIANGIINAVSMPMMICSGIFFSYHNFPDWLTAIIRQLPLTLIADSMRSIFTEGAGFAEIKQALLLLCGTGLILFIVGKRIYKWY
ncbi:MAG TPA: ABC transporter permease [Bacteroidia bacterium]